MKPGTFFTTAVVILLIASIAATASPQTVAPDRTLLNQQIAGLKRQLEENATKVAELMVQLEAADETAKAIFEAQIAEEKAQNDFLTEELGKVQQQIADIRQQEAEKLAADRERAAEERWRNTKVTAIQIRIAGNDLNPEAIGKKFQLTFSFCEDPAFGGECAEGKQTLVAKRGAELAVALPQKPSVYRIGEANSDTMQFEDKVSLKEKNLRVRDLDHLRIAIAPPEGAPAFRWTIGEIRIEIETPKDTIGLPAARMASALRGAPTVTALYDIPSAGEALEGADGSEAASKVFSRTDDASSLARLEEE